MAAQHHKCMSVQPALQLGQLPYRPEAPIQRWQTPRFNIVPSGRMEVTPARSCQPEAKGQLRRPTRLGAFMVSRKHLDSDAPASGEVLHQLIQIRPSKSVPARVGQYGDTSRSTYLSHHLGQRRPHVRDEARLALAKVVPEDVLHRPCNFQVDQEPREMRSTDQLRVPRVPEGSFVRAFESERFQRLGHPFRAPVPATANPREETLEWRIARVEAQADNVDGRLPPLARHLHAGHHAYSERGTGGPGFSPPCGMVMVGQRHDPYTMTRTQFNNLCWQQNAVGMDGMTVQVSVHGARSRPLVVCESLEFRYPDFKRAEPLDIGMPPGTTVVVVCISP